MSAAARARQPPSPPFIDPPGYGRHRPERTLLYQLVEQHYPAFRELRAAADRPLPDCVQQEFEAYLKCGRLEEGFLRVRCEQCHAEKLVAFSCKKRGFCPSCGGRRMAETAALLADEVLPERPLRQWVLSLPHALRFLLATNSQALTLVLGEVYRTISRHLIGKTSPTASRWGRGPGRSSLRCRRLRLDCRDWKLSRTVPPARAGSPCTPVWTSRRMSVRSSNDCAAM
jgi:ribosomal protein S27E